MALSGTPSNNYRGFTYQIAWSATQNTEGNYSTITCTHKLIIADQYTLKIAKRTNLCTVNDDAQTFESPAISKTTKSGSKTITLGTTKHTVKHNTDGSCKISILGTFKIDATISGVKVSCITVDADDALDPIKRKTASTYGKVTGNTIGQPITVEVIKSNTNFTHRFGYRLENGSWITSDTKYNGNITFAPSTDLLYLLSSSNRGTLQMSLVTYDEKGDQVGSHVYKSITVYTTGVSPTVGTISLDPVDIDSNNILVQGKNKLQISVSDSAAGTGSAIKSYTFSGPSVETTTTSSSITVGPISQPGKLTYTVTVTDARNNSAFNTKTITCYEHKAPYFTKFESYRCDSNGTQDDDEGTCIKCEFTVRYSSVNNTNEAESITIYGGPSNTPGKIETPSAITSSYNGMRTVSGHAIIENCSLDNSYNLYAVFIDKYGGRVTSSKSKTYGSSKIMNIPKAGNAIAFGKKATTANTLDSAWPIKTDEPAKTMNNFTHKTLNTIPTEGDTISGWRAQGNFATTQYTTQSVTDQPTERGILVNFTAGQRVNHLWLGSSYSTTEKGALYHRYGNSSNNNWDGSWKEILDEDNFTDYITDYIVEQDTSGVWNYRKWNSGFAECFGYQDVSSLNCSSSWGVLYFARVTLPALPFTFSEHPQITLGWNGSSSAFLGGVVNRSYSSCGYVNVYLPESGSTSGQIAITVTGKWK